MNRQYQYAFKNKVFSSTACEKAKKKTFIYCFETKCSTKYHVFVPFAKHEALLRSPAASELSRENTAQKQEGRCRRQKHISPAKISEICINPMRGARLSSDGAVNDHPKTERCRSAISRRLRSKPHCPKDYRKVFPTVHCLKKGIYTFLSDFFNPSDP